MTFSPECLAITHPTDAYSPWHIFPEPDLSVLQKQYNTVTKHFETKMGVSISLDTLARYPSFIPAFQQPSMNEVAIWSCAQHKGNVYRPKIVGVLINETSGSGAGTEPLEPALRNWAATQNLPVLEATKYDKVWGEFQEEARKETGKESYFFDYGKFAQDPHLLTAEQLKDYNLERRSLN